MDKSTFFRVWLGGSLLPQTPSKISGTRSSGNDTWRSALGYEHTYPRPAGVEELTMDILISKDAQPYQFTEAEGVNPDWTGGSGAVNFKGFLNDAINNCEPIEVVLERDPDGRKSEEGNFYVKDYSWTEDHANQSDFIFTVTLTNSDPMPMNQVNSEKTGDMITRARRKEGWIPEEDKKRRQSSSGSKKVTRASSSSTTTSHTTTTTTTRTTTTTGRG